MTDRGNPLLYYSSIYELRRCIREQEISPVQSCVFMVREGAQMRKLVLKMHVSVDGFVGGPNGEMKLLKVYEQMRK
jgi:hypothetical protein